MTTQIDIAEQVTMAKKLKVFFPKDLAQRYNVSRQTILNWERERRLPPRDVLNGRAAGVGWLPRTLEKVETEG